MFHTGLSTDAKPFEILQSDNPHELSEIVNEALSVGYELAWGGVSTHIGGGPFGYGGWSTLFQAVILKDRAKFEAWVKVKKEEEAEAEFQRQLIQKYTDKEVTYTPKNPQAKAGRAIIREVLITRVTLQEGRTIKVRGFMIRKSNGKLAEVSPDELDLTEIEEVHFEVKGQQ
jgi:hypothetical protein